MSEQPLRIYADFDALVRGVRDPRRTAVVLDTLGTLRDLANAGYRLVEGLPLIATAGSDHDEDLEGHGSAWYDPAKRRWVLEFDAAGVRRVPAAPRDRQGGFTCDRCEATIPVRSEAAIVRPGDGCPTCRVPLADFFAPPKNGDRE